MKHTNPDQRPAVVPPRPQGIPQALRQGRNFVLWRYEWSSERGEWSKIPYSVGGRRASSTNPQTWCGFEEAVAQSAAYDGFGRVLDGGALVVIDVDDCVEGDHLDDFARRLAERFKTYVEWSPSAKGIHIWTSGEWPNDGARNGKLEVYRKGRYMTMTGCRLSVATDVTRQPKELERLFEEHFARLPPASERRHGQDGPGPLGDEDLIARARVSSSGPLFVALFDQGDLSRYDGDQSRADLALADYLAWWTNGDAQRTDALFRRSALMRKKWDERHSADGRTYGQMTVEKALAELQGGYDPVVAMRNLRPEPALVEWAPVPSTLTFPLNALPPMVRRWAREVADTMPTAPEVAATFALGAISGAVGATRKIRLARTWSELPCLWICVVAEPGVARKTPVLKLSTRAIHAWQQEKAADYRAAKARYEQDLAAWQALPKEKRGERPEEARFTHALVSDVTIEKLASILEQNPRGVLMERDELLGWIRSMNQYRGGEGADRQHYLSIWAGSPIKVDRQKNPEPTYIRAPFVAITGGIQPTVVEQLRQSRVKTSDDGLFERLLWCWPEIMTMPPWSDREMDPDALRDYDHLLRNLLQLEGKIDEDTYTMRPATVHLTKHGEEAWIERYNRHVQQVNAHIELATLLAKRPGTAARLILIHHLIRYQSAGSVTDEWHADEASVEAGWDLADWYSQQATRVIGVATQSPEDAEAEVLVRWLDKHGIRTITARELQQRRAPGIKKASRAQTALMDLADRGYGTVGEERVTGGKRVVFNRVSSSVEVLRVLGGDGNSGDEGEWG